jgi:hypothetical protein
MSTLNPQQQTELNSYIEQGKPQNFEFVALKDYFLQRCFEALKNSEEARNRFNYLCPKKITGLNKQIKNGETLFYCMFTLESVFYNNAGFNNSAIKIQFIQTLLSITPDGEAVMPFLDVNNKLWINKNREVNELAEQKNHEMQLKFPGVIKTIARQGIALGERDIMPKTLDYLLYREFTEALRIGKNINQALAIINRTFINETLF